MSELTLNLFVILKSKQSQEWWLIIQYDHLFKRIIQEMNLQYHSLKSEYLLPTLEQAHLCSTHKCNLRSRVRWFTEFCNSHDLSQFAALFIDLGTKVSTVTSCLGFLCFYVNISLIISRRNDWSWYHSLKYTQ